jgi:hypothetical protein
VIEPPTAGQGARRVWSDSQGRIWVSEWHAGQVAVYDPQQDVWLEWRLPGDDPKAYAVYVDDEDMVWLSDFGVMRWYALIQTKRLLLVSRCPVRPLMSGKSWGGQTRYGELNQEWTS